MEKVNYELLEERENIASNKRCHYVKEMYCRYTNWLTNNPVIHRHFDEEECIMLFVQCKKCNVEKFLIVSTCTADLEMLYNLQKAGFKIGNPVIVSYEDLGSTYDKYGIEILM